MNLLKVCRCESGRKRKIRCQKCEGCLAQKCNQCHFCLKPSMKKPCVKRKCPYQVVPKCPCFTWRHFSLQNIHFWLFLAIFVWNHRWKSHVWKESVLKKLYPNVPATFKDNFIFCPKLHFGITNRCLTFFVKWLKE